MREQGVEGAGTGSRGRGNRNIPTKSYNIMGFSYLFPLNVGISPSLSHSLN